MSSTKHLKNLGQKWGFSVVDGRMRARMDLSRFAKNIPVAQAKLGEMVLASCKARMPLRDGSLQQRSHTEEGGKKVVFPGPYSRFLYRGRVMIGEHSRSPWARKGEKKIVTDRKLTYSRAEATDHWFEAAKETDKEYWVSAVKKELMKR